MIALLTVLVALPIGWAVRDRLAGFLAYGLAMAHLYTFQTATLVLEWVDGSEAAFQGSDLAGTWGYLATTTLVYAVGLGLVVLGQRLRSRRDRRRESVQLAGV